MIAPVQPWTITRYATEIYCREKLDLSPGTIENLETVCRQLDTWNAVSSGGGPFLLTELSRESLIDWMRWLADKTPTEGEMAVAWACCLAACFKRIDDLLRANPDRREQLMKLVLMMTEGLEVVDRFKSGLVSDEALAGCPDA
ncbi:MAG: hypothetical protein ABSE84_07920 [Isosphaeraceae bacterium]|jgi:hypothetical protein